MRVHEEYYATYIEDFERACVTRVVEGSND